MDLRLKMAQAAYRSEEIITNFRMHVADGSLRWFELRLSIIKQNARGQATVLLGCVRDINEYITQEMDMQQRMEKERWVQEQIGNILNDDSEQSFNNCLNALCAYIDTDYITLRWQDQQTESLQLVAHGGSKALKHNTAFIEPKASISSNDLPTSIKNLSRGEVYYSKINTENHLDNELIRTVKKFGARAIITIPITYEGKVEHFFSLIRCQSDDNLTKDQTNIAKAIGLTMAMMTARRRIAKELEESALRLYNVLDATQDGIWDWDTANNHYYVSPSFLYMLGYDEDVLPLSRSIVESFLVEPKHPEELFYDNQSQDSKSNVYFRQAIFRHRNGSNVDALVRGKQITWDAHGRPTHCVGATSYMQWCNSFCGVDFNAHSEQSQVQAVKVFEPSPLNKSIPVSEFSITKLVSNILTSVKLQNASRSLDFSLHFTNSLPASIVAQKENIALIPNLLYARATNVTRRGEINLSVSVVHGTNGSPELYFALSDQGKTLHISDPSLLTKGLPIALIQLKEVFAWVNQQGGRIDVQPNPKTHGNVVSMRLPLKEAIPTTNETTTKSIDSPDDINSEAPETRHVLLVEDNLVNQQVAKGILKRRGFEVEVANNGQEALDRLSKPDADKFDIVLLDMEMPILDGYQTAKAIRSNPCYEHLPVIAVTAHAMQEDKERCFNAGVNDHVAKPIRPDILFTAMDNLLDTDDSDAIA
ncbi:hypothetical protein NBRC116495_35040 [Aurantivibrio plasticivorans]